MAGMPLKMAAPSSNGAPFTDDDGTQCAARCLLCQSRRRQPARLGAWSTKARSSARCLGQPTDARRSSVMCWARNYLLSSYGANIAKPGGIAMNLHTDQWWMPEPIHRNPNPVPAGSLTRELEQPAWMIFRAMIAAAGGGECHVDAQPTSPKPTAPPASCRAAISMAAVPDAERDKDVVSNPG